MTMGGYDGFSLSKCSTILLARKVILMQDEPLRLVHLLTLWRERPARAGRPALWRFSVENVRTGERRGFASLEALMAFLRAQMEARGEKDDPP
jgi:hypothetical protein